MSISFSTLCSPTPPSLLSKSPRKTRLLASHRTNSLPLDSSLKPRLDFKLTNRFSEKNSKLSLGRNLGVLVKAENGDKGVGEEGENEARGLSTTPERFRYLMQEAPDPPVRWPYFIGISSCLAFLCCVLVPVFYYCY